MPLRSHWPQRVAICTGAGSFLLGLSALVGWYTHSLPLIQVLPYLPAMQRNTALSFALCGVALYLIVTERRKAAAAIATLPLLIAVAVGLQYVLNTNFGIDEWLGPGYVTVLAPSPGRMSQLTVACVLLIASALVAGGGPRCCVLLFRDPGADWLCYSDDRAGQLFELPHRPTKRLYLGPHCSGVAASATRYDSDGKRTFRRRVEGKYAGAAFSQVAAP
jgi:hypothetical protein